VKSHDSILRTAATINASLNPFYSTSNQKKDQVNSTMMKSTTAQLAATPFAEAESKVFTVAISPSTQEPCGIMVTEQSFRTAARLPLSLQTELQHGATHLATGHLRS
jgi:hypothetical protein